MSEGTTNSNGDNKLNNGVEYVDNEEIQNYWNKESIRLCVGMYFVKDVKERSDISSENSKKIRSEFVEMDSGEIGSIKYADMISAIFEPPVKQTSLKGKNKDEKKKSETPDKESDENGIDK